MLDKLFHKPEQEVVYLTPQCIEAKRRDAELKKINHFFKRKGINPQTLYNTLIYITPFFQHRENDWEELLRIIIKENCHRRPNFSRIQFWFLDTFDRSLNISEAKYLCRYVKMSSIADDKETKLRDAMDNIDLPPMKYERWVAAMYTLEGDDEIDGVKETKEETRGNFNFVSKALDHLAIAVGNILPKERLNFRKTYPVSSKESPPTREGRLNLTNKGAQRSRTRYIDNNNNSNTLNFQPTTETEIVSTDSTMDESDRNDTIDLTRSFHT